MARDEIPGYPGRHAAVMALRVTEPRPSGFAAGPRCLLPEGTGAPAANIPEVR